jgi:hypothetical protein
VGLLIADVRYFSLMNCGVAKSFRSGALSTSHRVGIDALFIFETPMPSCWLEKLPFLKKGVTSSPSNYRPISLTCVCCRIMERIINVDIIDYLHINKIISTAQHGFLHKHSTCTNLFESISDWSAALNNKHSVDVVYIDFQKAFDTVSHPKLITKLESYGFSGHLLSWIKAFLSNRTQAVTILECVSEKSVLQVECRRAAFLVLHFSLIYIYMIFVKLWQI